MFDGVRRRRQFSRLLTSMPLSVVHGSLIFSLVALSRVCEGWVEGRK